MKKYKTKLSAQNAREMILLIEFVIEMPDHLAISEMLAFAALAEVAIALKKKLVQYSREYKITFTDTQALAISYLYEEFIMQCVNVNQFTNRMMQINNEILQHYAI